MEFDAIPIPDFVFYCPKCSLVRGAGRLEMRSCKDCGEELICVEYQDIPRRLAPKVTKKGWIAVIILVTTVVGPIAPLILFFSAVMLAFWLVWVVGGVTIAVWIMYAEYNKAMSKLVRAYIPDDITRIPRMKGVKIFQLGKYLSLEVVTCSHCGMLIPGDSKFCKECGAGPSPD